MRTHARPPARERCLLAYFTRALAIERKALLASRVSSSNVQKLARGCPSLPKVLLLLLLLVPKSAAGQHGIFLVQQPRSPYVLLQIFFKVKFTTSNIGLNYCAHAHRCARLSLDWRPRARFARFSHPRGTPALDYVILKVKLRRVIALNYCAHGHPVRQVVARLEAELGHPS